MRFKPDELAKRLEWNDIDSGWLSEFTNAALREDLEGAGLVHRPLFYGDITTRIVEDSRSIEPHIVAREPMVVAGLKIIEVFLKTYRVDAQLDVFVEDGMHVQANAVLVAIKGDASGILQAERPILNTLQHLSGIATHTALYQKHLGDSRIRLMDTRKTLPGWRLLEKYAVGCGGAYNHRLGLFDRILIKDNHLALDLLPRLKDLLIQARSDYPAVPIEVEVDSLDQIPYVLEAGPDVVLLDNFSNRELEVALSLINGQVYTEASGGITMDRLADLAPLPLDFISTSQLNRGAKAVDIGLDF